MALSAKGGNKAMKKIDNVCVWLFWPVCWTSTITPLPSPCVWWLTFVKSRRGSLALWLPVHMADGKHLQDTGEQNASEVSTPPSSSKGFSPFQETFPTRPTQLSDSSFSTCFRPKDSNYGCIY